MTLFDVHKRPLPPFKEWIETRAPGAQATDFEAFADLTARTQDQPLEHLKPNEAAFGRMFMGASVAAVELCNMEAMKHGTDPDVIIASLARAFACAAMYAFASAAKPETPFRRIAKVMTEDFRAAAMLAADELTKKSEAETEAG